MIKSEGYKLIEKIQNFGIDKTQLFFDEINVLFQELKVTKKSKTIICTLTNDVNELGVILCSRKVFEIEKKAGETFIKMVVQNEDLDKIPINYKDDYQYYNNSTFVKIKFEDYFKHRNELFPLLINSLKLDKCEKTQYLSSHSELLYKVISNKKNRTEAFDCVDVNLKDWKKYLINLSQQPRYLNIIQNTEFLLEKGRQSLKKVKKAFEIFGIDKLPFLATKIEEESKKLKGKGKTVQLLKRLSPNERQLIEKINIFYAYADDKALNKRNLNEYNDTRVMAKTNYAQLQFIIDWLRYASDSSVREKQISLIRILNFFEHPENNFSMVSEGHRERINSYLFDNKLIISGEDDSRLINEFSFLNLNLVNNDNRGYLITRLLYEPKFKFIFWLHSKENNMKVINLKQLVEALKQKQLEDDFRYFNISFDKVKTYKKNKYVWFSEDNSIKESNLDRHFEIYEQDEDICLDIHFESKKSNKNQKYFNELEHQLPQNVDWFNWPKSQKTSKSLRHKKTFKYNDTNLVENVYKALKDLIEAGKLVAKIGQKQTNIVMEDNKKQPINQILFGPPGTGKTYKTKELAVNIIDGEIPKQREELSKRYKELIESEQIQFTTFHQSMSYEDFVEGLKPILTKDDEKNDVGDIGYEIKNGIFKDMCLNAESFKEYSANINQFNLKETDFEDKNIFKISLGNTLKATGNKVYEYCRDNKYIALGWGGDIDYSGVKNKKEIINKYTDNTGLIPSPSDFNIRAINHFKLNMQIGDLVFVSHGNKLLKAVGKIVGEYEYNKAPLKGYYHYRKIEWFFTDIKIPVTKVYEKEFSQQSIYEMQTDKINIPFLTEKETLKKSENSNNVVLIIDEINRGNVSAIFGELITLIEEDKRQGKNEEIEVVLPYSKEPFSVPDNLYIIGTMNTADRSVEALDSALRRRFSFEEVAPDSEVLKDIVIEGINLSQLLEAINGRIELLLDKDHKIGHSYFIKVKNLNDLKQVFKDKIIPLLEEYFYGDFGKIGLILGSDFVTKSENKISFVSDFEKDYEDSEMLKERLIYSITPDTDWKKESFKNIYE